MKMKKKKKAYRDDETPGQLVFINFDIIDEMWKRGIV